MEKCPYCSWIIDWEYVDPSSENDFHDGCFTCRSCNKKFIVKSWVEYEITKEGLC